MVRTGRIEIESWPLNAGGATIKYDGKVVADGLNVISAFMFIGGLLAGNPCTVEMNMEHPPWGTPARVNYEQGREVVATLDRDRAEEVDKKSGKRQLMKTAAKRKAKK